MKKWFRRHKQKFVLVIVIFLVLALALGGLAGFLTM